MKINWVTELETFRAELHRLYLIACKKIIGAREIARALSLLLILSSCQKSEPHLAFFDTAFCLRDLQALAPSQIKLNLVMQIESEEKICKLAPQHPARHGDRVLIQFFKNLGPHSPSFTLSLYSLFHLNGMTSESDWRKALLSVKENGVHLVASAVAYRGELVTHELPPLFLASGQWGGRVKKDDLFFPQELIKEKEDYRKHTLVFGSYYLDSLHQEAYDDQTLLYPDLVDYWFASTNDDFLSGSSNALAIGTARAMSFCGENILDFEQLKECLKKREVIVTTIGKGKLPQY